MYILIRNTLVALFLLYLAFVHSPSLARSQEKPYFVTYDHYQEEPDAIFWVLTNGVVRKGVLVWSKLPEPQRWQLVSYIKSLGAAPATEESLPAPKSA